MEAALFIYLAVEHQNDCLAAAEQSTFSVIKMVKKKIARLAGVGLAGLYRLWSERCG